MSKFASIAFAAFLTVAALPSAASPITAVGRGNILYAFDTATPGAVTSLGAISGLGAGESIVGIDYRPANGLLYGLSDQSRLFVISTSGSPLATQVGSSGAFALAGTSFGFDFNPMADRIRVVSDADQNLRLNPNDGTLTATDGTLAFAAGDANFGANPNIIAAAYNNNVAGAASTTLFVLDSTLNILASQNPPNAGTLNTIGGAGNPAVISGFDISGATGEAFAFWAAGGGLDALFLINLAGGVTNLGVIGGGQLGLIDFSINPNVVAEPESLTLVGLALAAMALARRRKTVR